MLNALMLLIAVPAAEPVNVLFIAVDDLKPTLGCYGDPHAKTPNIDALAASGTTFTSAYCQQAVCNPSRVSLLTGRRPDTTKVYDLQTFFRDADPDAVPLPEHFKRNGYHSQGYGKIYHVGHGVGDDEQSWSRVGPAITAPRYSRETQNRVDTANRRKRRANGGRLRTQDRVRGPAFEAPEVKDTDLRDGEIANRVGHLIRKHAAAAKSGEQPFFIACGFLNPHLPFVAPKKYWDLYDAAELPVPDAATRPHAVPAGAPKFAGSGWGELRAYEDMPKSGPVTAEQARTLVHGYYAAVSYIDAQVGRVLTQLEEQGLRESTVVVLWGDHGWHLGDHGLWCKHTNYEQATRVPLILSVPGQANAGATCDALVEFVDIYPTLVEACGLPMPEGLEGTSLLPLLEDPDREWKSAAFHLYPRGGRMGRAIRTRTHRLVRWTNPRGGEAAVELYDLAADPDETASIAADNPDLVAELKSQLAAGWQAAVPGE